VTITCAALLMLWPLPSRCSGRGLYRRLATMMSRAILGCGIGSGASRRRAAAHADSVRLESHVQPGSFVPVALGLPRCRFFLSGFLKKLVPLGIISWLLGFFTVPQDPRRNVVTSGAECAAPDR
jgi:hypothetical protein